MIRIVVAMAGRGMRFAEAGYAIPKPLIPIHGVPMVEFVVGNVRPRRPHQFIFAALDEHLDRWNLRAILERIAPGCIVISVEGVTEGAASTVLLARRWIDAPEPLLVANCDQWVDTDIDLFVDELVRGPADGLIMTMRADDPRWSFVGFDGAGRVDRVVEKEVISNEATVGIYGFRRGSDFVRAADAMVAGNHRVKGEFYLAPVYNQVIASGGRVDVHSVGSLGEGMHGLGTPEDVERFLRLPISKTAVARDRTP